MRTSFCFVLFCIIAYRWQYDGAEVEGPQTELQASDMILMNPGDSQEVEINLAKYISFSTVNKYQVNKQREFLSRMLVNVLYLFTPPLKFYKNRAHPMTKMNLFYNYYELLILPLPLKMYSYLL